MDASSWWERDQPAWRSRAGCVRRPSRCGCSTADGPAVTSRALGLQPRGVEVLDRLGALGDLPDRGLAIRNVVITVNGVELARLPVEQSMQRLGGRTRRC